MNKETVKKEMLHLYEFHVWANDRVFRHLQELGPEAVHQPLTSVFPSVFETLVHLYRVDTVWLYAMSGRGEQIVERVGQIAEEMKGKELDYIDAKYRDLYEETRTFLKELPDAGLVTPYHHPQYGTLHATYADIVRHIVNHGTYHRGNLSAMLRQQGLNGIPTDYVFYLYEFPTATE